MVLVLLYRKGLNTLCWDNFKKSEDISKLPSNYQELEYCAINNAEYAPEICNEFAAKLLPLYLKDIHVEQMYFLGETDEKMKNGIYFIMHFCNWLYHNLYTNEKITLNLQLNNNSLQ